MNLRDLNYSVQTPRPHVDAKPLKDVNNKRTSSRVRGGWDVYPTLYSRCSVEPRSSSMGRGRNSPHSYNCKDLKMEDSDGEPLVMDEEDIELSRKKKELEEIEARIIHKKAAIAVKTVEIIEKNVMSGDEELVMCKGKTLKERVEEILKQRHPFSFSSKVQSPKEKGKPTLRKAGLLQEDHPLKLSVRAAVKHRFSDPRVFSPAREVSDVPLPPPSRSAVSPVEEEKGTKNGFDLFLHMLNRGADANLKNMVSDVPLPPPGRSVVSPVEEEKGTKNGFDLFLHMLNKGADANLKNMLPDVPLPPPSQSVTPPGVDNSVKKSFERFLQVFNKEKDFNLNNMVPDVPVPPPMQSVASSKGDNQSVDRGFERFLKVLNKGVDIHFLSRIVNDNVEDLQNVHPSSQTGKLDPPLMSKSPGSNSEASLPGCSRTSGTESRTDSLRREPSFPDPKEKITNKIKQNVSSSNRSASSVSEKKEEQKETLKLDQKHEQLQNIVKTLGLNLDMEELNQLTDRTQERLYGKSSEGSQRADSRGEKQSLHRSSHREGSRSASSSSSYSSSSSCSSTSRSRSNSRDLSRSPYHHRSHSRNSRERQKPKRSHSHERRRDGSRDGDQNEVRREAEKCHYKDEAHLDPHSAGASFLEYSLPQYSNDFDCYRNSYSDETNSYWSLNHSDSTTPSFSSYQHSYSQPGDLSSFVPHDRTYPQPEQGDLDNPLLFLNPELALSEGQIGNVLGPRFLTVINTKQSSSERHLLQITNASRHRRGQKRNKRPKKKEKAKRRPLSKHSVDSKKTKASLTCTSQVVVPQAEEDKAEDSEEEKPQPTDEEIKSNLRKKLQAFNQKAKQVKQFHNSEAMRPSDSLTFELS